MIFRPASEAGSPCIPDRCDAAISSPIKLVSLEEAQLRYKASKRNLIMPFDNFIVSGRKKVRPCRRTVSASQSEVECEVAQTPPHTTASPVILRCLRTVYSTIGDASDRKPRSSLRDKFRKFALSPIASSNNLRTDAESILLASQHVNHIDLHLNESIEFIDASSSDDSDNEIELNCVKPRKKVSIPSDKKMSENLVIANPDFFLQRGKS